MNLEDRGQTAVLGLILMIGIVAVTSVGILVFAGSSITDLEHQSEEERITQTFRELSHTMSTVAAEQESTRNVQIEVGEHGAVTKTDAGWIRISSEYLDEDVNISLGAIEYHGDDGSTIAYQGGGIWREVGQDTFMISTPELHYDRSAETLFLPVISVSGEQRISSGTVSVAYNGSPETFKDASIVKNENLTITIHSDYYRGWERYFRTQAGDTVVESVDHDARTVTARLGYVDMSQAFSSGAQVPSEDAVECQPEPCDIQDETTSGAMQPLDEVIDEVIDDAFSGEMDVNASLGTVDDDTYTGEDRLTAGNYTSTGIDGGSLEVDLSEGNVTLVVNGSITNPDIRVTDRSEGNSISIYTSGNLDAEGGEDRAICVDIDDGCEEDTSGDTIRIFGKSTSWAMIGPGEFRYEGILYLASDEDTWPNRPTHGHCDESHQVCIHSASVSVFGSIVAATVHGQANPEFTYDESLGDTSIDLYPDHYTLPPQLAYLNLVHHRVDIDTS